MFERSTIRAVAAVIPKERQQIDDFIPLYGEKIVGRIRKATGIEEIRIAPKDLTAADYCIAAAEQIFATQVCPPANVDGVVFVSQTPDYLIPHTSATIQHRLGLPTNTIAMDINFGCAGYIYGLFQAMLLVETGNCCNVLLCSGDTLSRHIHPMDRSLRMVMGDAGTATLVSAYENASPSAFSFFTDGGGASLLQIPAGGSRMPCEKGVTDVVTVDEEGNEHTLENLFMNGTEIMTFALQRVPQVVDEVLSKIDWAKEEVALFALHQANAFMVKYIAKRMKVDAAKVPINVKLTGNTSSASVPLMLCNVYPGINKNLQKVVCCGFGTGLACAAGAVDLSRTEICAPIEI